MSETKSPAPVNPAEAFESLILLSHRWTAMVGASSIMAAHSMTVPSFVILTTAAAEPGTPLGKLSRKAGLEKADAVSAMRSLKIAGLIDEAASPEGKGRNLTATDKGRETLAALRAGFADAAGEVPEANWRAVPRLAAILRRSSRVLAKPAADDAEAA